MRDPIVNIAVKAARAAGNIIIRSMGRLDTVQISEKNPNDYVTEIDQQAEKEIISVIRKAHPNHGILAEESGETLGSDDDYVWIIDPIDGTRNFIHGLPHFAVSIAITYKGRIEHGVIYDPVRQELFTATRGRGAQLNERRIRVSSRNKMEGSLLATGFASQRTKELLTAYTDTLTSILQVSGDVRRAGAATLDLAYVACGRLDGFWETGLKIWDIAAGVILIKEAGGLICDFNSGEDYLKSGNVIASNPKLLKPLLQAVQPNFVGAI